jgi:regulatory protein
MTDDFAAGLRRAALDLLARREQSAAELRGKLCRRFGEGGEVVAAVDRVIERLQAEQLQSDARFAEHFVRYRRTTGHGPLRIRQELNHRGIADELRDAVLDPRDPDWIDLACEVHRKRFEHTAPAGSREQARQARFLQQRGFSHEQVRAALRRNGNRSTEPA